ncbi:RDD family protein [Alkalibacillus haloalkaliphilus]|uniref:RDD family protein n=1 Tax=Alkalibacillus haloalkaliphilus TaxID=94136 RepID=UPI002936CD07|nr:RDD family protein [Alkalibacillus haloalkaliphilus]MDV2582613.1 RDD family protein [Alkalibacillus haloalkaliphilus]
MALNFTQLKPAGFWMRFLAVLVDGIVILALSWVIAVLIGDEAYFQSFQAEAAEQFATTSDNIANLVYSVIFVIGFTASQLKGSPGKLICRIQVVNPDMSKISIWKSIGRYFSYILSALPLAIGYMIAGWNKDKKALHDMICNTRVVYRDKRRS